MSRAKVDGVVFADENVSNHDAESSKMGMPFFTSSISTFNPRPYLPLSSSSINRGKAVAEVALKNREPPVNAALQKPLDVAPEDPDAVFIRYPDPTLPDDEDFPDGLTYIVLAQHPNWFLVSDDFENTEGAKENRVMYPNNLEPPRGWFGDMKKGPYKSAPQEQAFLRCTFCRRGYQGVNAKSMWRRHVLEKHKVPMSNRREGPNGTSEGGRSGRSSNKENKRASSAAPVTAPPVPAKLRTAYTVPNFSEQRPLSAKNARERSKAVSSSTDTEAKPVNEFPDMKPEPHQSSSMPFKEPQLVPDDGSKRSWTQVSSGDLQLPPSSPLGEESSQASRLLPGFGGSPNHRVMMPWKFPSPSHPLHFDPEELCLAVPIRGIAGDGLQSGYVPVQMSPFPGMKTPAALQLSSPAGPDSPLSRKFVTGRVLGWKRKTSSRSKLPPLPEPSPVRPYSGSLAFNVSYDFGSPERPQTTDLEEGDTSFSSMSDWFDFSSPRKGIGSSALTSLPDTPLKRTSSTSALDDLQLKSPIKGLFSPRKGPAPSLGLGFNFKVDLTSSSSKKRTRSDEEHGSLSDGLAEAELGKPFKRRLCQDDAEEPPLTDAGSEDQSSASASSPPLKRRLTL